MEADLDLNLQPPSPRGSDGQSLYMPASPVLSAGYQSFGDEDSMGSAGDLVPAPTSDWSVTEDP